MDLDLKPLDSLNSIRKQSRSLDNRIQSILYDAQFVETVAAYFKKPLVANRRCGSWYVDPATMAAECYFKSTDGHTHQWSFSLRRLNLHLLPIVEKFSGAVIVDSTRRGKLMPDAASKTIPIWCSVLNCANGFDDRLWVPPRVVSNSEREQIQAKIKGWAAELEQVAKDFKLSKPLRPIWFTHGDVFQDQAPEFDEFLPVIICTASFQAQDGEQPMQNFTYVQGAADDHELWAGALTPELFWQYPELRSVKSEQELGQLLKSIKLRAKTTKVVQVTRHLQLSSEGNGIDLRSLPAGKKGSRLLSNRLPDICADFAAQFAKSPRVLIVADPNSDLGASVALMLDALYFDLDGNYRGKRQDHCQKAEVNQRLAVISAACGNVPSRTTLNIIGSFLRGSWD